MADLNLEAVARLAGYELAPIGEVQRLSAHSTTLNTIAWRIATALGDVPDGATEVHGDPTEQADRLIAEVERLRTELADMRVERDWLLAEADDDTRRRFHHARRTQAAYDAHRLEVPRG